MSSRALTASEARKAPLPRPAPRRSSLWARLFGTRAPAPLLDVRLTGAEVVVGGKAMGHVLRSTLDPISGHESQLIVRYVAAPGRNRCVSVPIHWVAARPDDRVVLGVAATSLDALPDYDPFRLTLPAGRRPDTHG